MQLSHVWEFQEGLFLFGLVWERLGCRLNGDFSGQPKLSKQFIVSCNDFCSLTLRTTFEFTFISENSWLKC